MIPISKFLKQLFSLKLLQQSFILRYCIYAIHAKLEVFQVFFFAIFRLHSLLFIVSSKKKMKKNISYIMQYEQYVIISNICYFSYTFVFWICKGKKNESFVRHLLDFTIYEAWFMYVSYKGFYSKKNYIPIIPTVS